MSNSPFLNSIRTDMRQKGYALKTEKTYLHWIKRFILFHKKRHPQTMGSEEVRLFLSSLANSRHVAINTQKIALNALAFLYNRFLQQPLGDIDYIPASKPRRLPSVISANEVQRILQVMDTRNEPRQPGGCKLKTAPVRPVVAARPAEYVCSEDLFY